jgi:hypothetical protein
MPYRNPCTLYIHLAFTYFVGPSSVVWNELGLAPPFPPMRVFVVQWLRALSRLCEVALILFIHHALRLLLIRFSATSHTRLRACDHCNSSTLIGGKGRAGPSSLHTYAWGTNRLQRWMSNLHGFLHGTKWIMFHGNLDCLPRPPFGGRPNTKPGDHGTPNAHNYWFILFYHVRGPAWIESHWDSIWLRAWSQMASHYPWGSVTTLHDFGGVLGQPSDTFFWSLTSSWSRLLACVWSGPLWNGTCVALVSLRWSIHKNHVIYHMSLDFVTVPESARLLNSHCVFEDFVQFLSNKFIYDVYSLILIEPCTDQM